MEKDFSDNSDSDSEYQMLPNFEMKDDDDDSFDLATDSESESDDDTAAPGTENVELSMGDLLKLQDKVGMKEFGKIDISTLAKERKPTFSRTSKRDFEDMSSSGKNKPKVVPMRRRVARSMNSLTPGEKIARKIVRDPRFDDLSGKLDMVAWKKNYAHIRETRKQEKEILKKELNSETDPDKKKKIKLIIQRIENQVREQKKNEKLQMLKSEERQGYIESLKQGKMPKFSSNKEKKLLLKESQIEEMKKEKRYDKYLIRQEKKQLNKERKSRTFS